MKNQNSEHAAISKFNDALTQFEQITGKKDFAKFWRIVFSKAKELTDPQSEKHRKTVLSTIKEIREIRLEGASEDDIQQYRQRILNTAEVEIPEKELPGKADDPSTPLGFYRYLSPVKQKDGYFVAYAPCATSTFEIAFHGPGVTLPFVKNVHPELKESALLEFGETVRELNNKLKGGREQFLQNYCISSIDPIKFNFPLLPLVQRQNFYQEGRRFYGQGAINYYMAAVTSGMVIPEEYYDQKLYFEHGPGITKVENLTPGSFRETLIEDNTTWHELSLRSLKSLNKNNPNQESINPYRTIYFDSALMRLELTGGQFHYLIEVEGTGRTLRAHYEHWARKGLGNEYLTDAMNVLSYFLSNPKVQMYLVRSFDTAWRSNLPVNGRIREIFEKAQIEGTYVAALISDRVSVYTARDRVLRKINNSLWANPAVLDWISRTSEINWQALLYKMLGIAEPDIRYLLENDRSSLPIWEQYIHNPTKRLFNEKNRIKKEGKDVTKLARAIIEELLKPDFNILTRGTEREFLTLKELESIFDRSYGRLRQWVKGFNLEAYSDPTIREHRFKKEDLRRFIMIELSSERGFPKHEIEQFLNNLDTVFEKGMKDV